MNKQKILFILSIITILLLTLLTQLNQKPITSGKIKEIKYQEKYIKISLEKEETEMIAFTNSILNIKKGDNIDIYGKQDPYKGEKQIIINKIVKLKTSNQDK